jgi:hypothetical protein
MSTIRKIKDLMTIGLMALVALGGSQALARGLQPMGSPATPSVHTSPGVHTTPGTHTTHGIHTTPTAPSTTQSPSDFGIIQQDEQTIQQEEQQNQNYEQQQQQFRNRDRQNMTPQGSETPSVETPFGH